MFASFSDMDMTYHMFANFLQCLGAPLEPLSVYHASNHGVSVFLGVVAKYRFGSSLIVWDHGLLWRERMKGLSEICHFSLFTRNALVGLLTFCARLVFHNCDAIVACNSKAGPEWEQYINGGIQGSMSWERQRMRMSFITNGMCINRFKPIRSTEEPYPCAVMLSHLYDLKDVKNAILCADKIVNIWKLREFRLIIY